MSVYRRFLAAALVAATGLLATVAEGHAERRIALVIGMSQYQNVPKLLNPPHDAQEVSAALQSVGFDSVTIKTELTREQLVTALRDFAAEADQADWAMVYFSGHGIEIGGVNYLIPIDARLKVDRDVEYETVDLNKVLTAVASSHKLHIAVLDACRDNPFAARMTRSIATRSISRGLSAVEPDPGTLVVYAAKAGQVALDGDGGNSPFASALVKRLRTPNLEIRRLFDLVRDDVIEQTSRQQQPFSYGSLPGREDFYFMRAAATAPLPSPTPAPDNGQFDKLSAELRQMREELAAAKKAAETAAKPPPATPPPAQTPAPTSAPVPFPAPRGSYGPSAADEFVLHLSPLDRTHVQVALTSLGFDTQGKHGTFDQRTRLMIAAWQTTRHREQTMFLNDAHYRALLQEGAAAVSKYDEDQKRSQNSPGSVSTPSAAPSTPTTPTTPPPLPSNWIEYRSPKEQGQSYRILFPGKPTGDVQLVSKTGTNLLSYSQTYKSPAEELILSASYIDIAGIVAADVYRLFVNDMRKFGQVVEEKNVTVAGLPAFRLRLNARLQAYALLLVKGNRSYTIQCYAPIDGSRQSECERFLASFAPL